MLDALLAVFTYIKPHRLYDKVAQNFVDWSISYLLSDLRIKRKLYDEAFKALIFEFWLPLIGCKPRSFESHMNFLIFNEWMEPGFIAGFFKTPYIASPISFVLPSLRIARDSDVILYGAGAAGVELYLQIKQSGIYNIVTWVDNQAGSQSKQGFPVELPIVISKIDFDFILIALINSAQVAEINDTLINMNVPVTKIIRVFA
jgi:FlaA1/EpsC-like NDP-sugar epimerase